MKFLKSKEILIVILITLFGFLVRIAFINKVPPSLFGDEVDVGYQAYSILKTGKDYMGNFMPLHFQSLAEYRTPLYLYSAIPTVWMFGISPLGVRLPSVIFGTLTLPAIYFLTKELFKKRKVSLLALLILMITPWHIHYSRSGFEVSELMFFLTFGLLLFLKGLKKPKYLIFSSILLAFTPWIYNTAKFYLPVFLIVILVVWFKKLAKVSKKYLIASCMAFMIIETPFFFSTVFGGGEERFNLVSIFNDPEMQGNIGFSRIEESGAAKFVGVSVFQSSFVGRVFNNKFFYFLDEFSKNYIKSFSSDFMFVRGDTTPRHNVISFGEFLPIFGPFLLFGIFELMVGKYRKRLKLFLFLWLITSPIASALTRDGANHATRLILVLPSMVVFISLGVLWFLRIFSRKTTRLIGLFLMVFTLFYFVRYLNDYFFHYPFQTERLWHAGYQDAVLEAQSLSGKYKRVIFSSFDEPSLLFYLGWSNYPPSRFQSEYPNDKLDLKNYGESYKLGNFYFPPVGTGHNLYNLAPIVADGDLYITPFREIDFDLVKEPERIPRDIKLVHVSFYPSGTPAFYMFEKNNLVGQ